MTWWQIALVIWFALQIPAAIAIGKLIHWRVSR